MERTAHRDPWFIQPVIFILLTLCGLLIGLSGYFPIQPAFLGRSLRIGLPVVILAVIFFLNRSERGKKYLPLSLAFFSVALGLAIDVFAGNLLLDGLHWSTNTPQGWAAGKFGEAIPVILCILAVTRWSGEDFQSLYLIKGRLASGLLLSLIPMAIITIPYVTLGGLQATLALPSGTVLGWLPWMIIFSISNGFFEELWFRGSWMPRYAPHLGPTGALVSTSLVFILFHVLVYWGQPAAVLLQLTAAWTILGFSCGILTQKTGSLWGAVVTHAYADFIFILGAFAAM